MLPVRTSPDDGPTWRQRGPCARTLAGDDATLAALAGPHHAALRRLAGAFGHHPAAAERLARATWRATLAALDHLPPQRQLRICLLRRLARSARAGVAPAPGPAVPASLPAEPRARFDGAGRWAQPPRPWDASRPDDAALRAALQEAMAALPPDERTVAVLRDVEGLGPEDACAILGIAAEEQRRRLHRARVAVHAAVEARLGGPSPGGATRGPPEVET